MVDNKEPPEEMPRNPTKPTSKNQLKLLFQEAHKQLQKLVSVSQKHKMTSSAPSTVPPHEPVKREEKRKSVPMTGKREDWDNALMFTEALEDMRLITYCVTERRRHSHHWISPDEQNGSPITKELVDNLFDINSPMTGYSLPSGPSVAEEDSESSSSGSEDDDSSSKSQETNEALSEEQQCVKTDDEDVSKLDSSGDQVPPKPKKRVSFASDDECVTVHFFEKERKISWVRHCCDTFMHNLFNESNKAAVTSS